MALIGTLIAESLLPGSVLENVVLLVHKISREGLAGEPLMWTFLDFEAADDDADRLATDLEGVLDPDGGWYCDFRNGAECFVVFSGRTFRYPRGDSTGRAEATAYGRSVGVPEEQLDWPE